MQQDQRNKPHRNDGQRRQCGPLELLLRGECVDLRGQRLKVKWPQQQRRGQLFHGIDEDQQRRRADRGPQ